MSVQMPHLAKAALPQHSQEGEVVQLDVVQAVERQPVGVGVVRLVNQLLTWA